jgi:hypothetical protein
MKSPLKEIKCARDGKCSKIFGAMSFCQLAVSPTDTCFLGKEVGFVDYWMRNKKRRLVPFKAVSSLFLLLCQVDKMNEHCGFLVVGLSCKLAVLSITANE